MTKLVKTLARSLGHCPKITREQVVAMYVGSKRERYEKARLELERRGEFIDARIKMFVKQEAVEVKSSKPNPACRAIQFREFTYGLQLAQYVKSIEHALYQAAGPRPYPTTQFIAKCLTPKGRAELIQSKFNAMPGCTVLELDASRFDAHVSAELLTVEHSFYRKINPDKHFGKLLHHQINNKGRASGSDFSLSYSIKGGRMSGEMTTASSNCVSMATMLAIFGQDHFQKYDFLVDGDDSVFFFVGNMPDEERIKEYFLQFGMRMKIDNVTRHLQEITFCQGRLVDLPEGPTMVRDPFKILSRVTVNMKFVDVRQRANLLKTISLGELSLLRGCPVIQPFLQKMIQVSEEVGGKKVLGRHVIEDYRLKRDLPGDWWQDKNTPITPEARASFARAWGIEIGEQRDLERRILDGAYPNMLVPSTLGNAVELKRWLFDVHRREVVQ